MNPTGQPLTLRINHKRLGLLAAIGLVIFLFLQVFPSTASDTLEIQSTKIISKEKAAEAAKTFIQSHFDNITTLGKPIITYQSKSDLYGYLSKENLLKSYNKKFEKKVPYDVYRVRYTDVDQSGHYIDVDVHMTTGKVVGYTIDSMKSEYSMNLIFNEKSEQRKQSVQRNLEGNLSLSDKESLAAPVLKEWGYSKQSLTLVTKDNEPGLVYTVPNSKIGNSQLELKFSFVDGEIRSFEPTFTVPASHTAYVKSETTKAKWMTFAGYAFLTFVLGILAIVYSIITRAHTSFKRGIFLTILYFVISMAGTYNMLPLLEGEGLTDGYLVFGILFQAVFTLFMCALLYFSLVGGNGLWKKEGLNPWPRAKEPGYGKYVLNSMIVGYEWAFILLGVQSIIYIILENTIHTWSTTDTSQSPYNMLYPWLFPTMAWLAGISEEATYRLFGIKMMKKIVKNTFLACLIPTIIWAFGHTLYPIYPVVSRPIELIIIGLLFSFIFLRYGFIAVMFAHVIFDSILMGYGLVTVGGTLNISVGIASIIIPAIVAYIIYLFNPAKKEKPYVTTPHLEGQQ
ncbi:type II CAAX endopeptidase family protein [Paenibacillus sediminis]|uniref:CPBP family intramembrane metalloprotease n=1 Tax=Paenibacillus sediminis TaxID=664909 RepID=A0ABS4H611_9BACL|nr:type II CAAX endopeptidase family protein [Paenibacillus sediminis]MBP1937911.1 hypothetical protein [Paenibacillus sediminis]